MDPFLNGKTALVTGGTRGIGRAIAESLLGAGARVAICGRSQDSVTAAVQQMKAAGSAQVWGIPCDVRDREAVSRMFLEVDRGPGELDILVNNAGVGAFAPVAETDPAGWERVIGTNLSGVFHCSREALPRMKKRGGGFIVQIGSLAGKNPFAGGAAYNASKFGLIGFSEAMMLDHRNDGVRVCTILPGSVNTEFSPRSQPAGWKIAPADIAEIVLAVLRMPERTMISHVEVRPSRPMKS
jgi:NAD(P)-dependent dehydrogenase (short-subunit alcohol dehydrogenase family)